MVPSTPTDADAAPLRFEFVENHLEFSLAWLSEYYGSYKWGAFRVLAGPTMAFLGYRLGALRPGEWLALCGTGLFGYGVYYALKPLLQVALLVRKRRKAGAAHTTTEVVVASTGVVIRSGRAEMNLGWDRIQGAGWRSRYFWIELVGGARAVIPTRVIGDRLSLEGWFRKQGKWPP